MLSCLYPKLSSSTDNHFSSSGYSAGDTPTSTVQLSPTVNLSHEYALAIHTHSYGELRSMLNSGNFSNKRGLVDISEDPQLLERVIQPGRESIPEALSLIAHSSLADLLGTYFEHSENTSRLCLFLYQSVRRARLIYKAIHNFLDNLHLEPDSSSYSLSHSECKLAFNVFLEFNRCENPFLSPGEHAFDNMQKCFSQLRQQLDHDFRKSQSKINFKRRCSKGSAWCLIGTTVGVIISAVTRASHALAALVACSMSPLILPSGTQKKEMVHLAQLDAAARGAYVLHNDLDTTDRLVARLHTAIENDKLLIHLGLERGVDRHPIQEILKQFRRNRSNFIQQLGDLEEHLLLCLATSNRTRSLLLQEIHMHQNQV